jgi:hypothetical protein
LKDEDKYIDKRNVIDNITDYACGQRQIETQKDGQTGINNEYFFLIFNSLLEEQTV